VPVGPVPDHIDAFLRAPRPAVMGTLLADGSPSTVATWYLWLGDNRVLFSHHQGGFRERNLIRDGRVALTVLDDDWYDQVSLRGRVIEMRADPDWADVDAICRHYRGVAYPRDAEYHPSTVIVEVDAWHEFHSTTRTHPEPPISLDHLVLHVGNWERSNAFYREVLGAELVEAPHGGVMYRIGSHQLNLHGPGVDAHPVAARPVEPGNSDLCFEWHGPIADAVAHLERCGVTVELGPVTRFGARGNGASVYFRDPDGSLLEFIAYDAP
jgi:PPOX class probable F420-dependent enzyme